MAAETNSVSPIKNTDDSASGNVVSVSDEASSVKGLLIAVESSSTGGFEGKHAFDLGSASDGCVESEELKTDYTDSLLDFKVKGDLQEPKNLSNEERVDLDSLEFKKQQLLRDLEAGSIFGGITVSVENTLMLESFSYAAPESVVMDGNEIVGNHFQVDGSERGSLKIKLIDDTAVIEPTTGIPGLGIEAGYLKKPKRTRRKGKSAKKAAFQYNSGGDGAQTMYSREEMLALRFVGVVQQKRLWREVYNGLGDVAEEYASLVGSKNPKQRSPHGPGILGEESCKEEGIELGSVEDSEPKNVYVSCEDHSTKNAKQEFEEDSDDSDEYYSSIQRPAFAVEGEPNFDAGPPEDGLEYLRRVRWEAARIPKVKVAKLDSNKLYKEQTAYMPVIPDIPKCPEHLMPTKEWEEAFLSDFSRLRVALSQADAARAEMSSHILLIEKPVYCEEEDAHPDLKEEEEAVLAMVDAPSSFDVLGSSLGMISISTTLSLILGMDSVSRVSKLKKRISEFEAMTVLSREDCVWLFALCAAVDTPLHADTSASVRSLLRKCASLRADKVEADEEVVMLNIMATICGCYFGQSGSNTTV